MYPPDTSSTYRPTTRKPLAQPHSTASLTHYPLHPATNELPLTTLGPRHAHHVPHPPSRTPTAQQRERRSPHLTPMHHPTPPRSRCCDDRANLGPSPCCI